MSTIAITGASGFVGRHVVARVLEDGHKVRALIRPVTYAAPLRGKAELAYGDVREPETLAAFLAGADNVVHLASTFSGEDDITATVAEGTRNVVEAAREAGVGRFVYMSCLPADAASESPFYAAKWRAEQFVRGSALPYVILRPSLVLGRGDGVVRPLADLIRSLPVIPLPGQGMQRQQPIDVEDLAHCVALSVTREELLNAEISVGGPVYLTLRYLVDLIQGQIGVAKPKLLLPPRWVPPLSRITPKSARDLFTGPRLAAFEQMSAASPGIVDREFGFQPASVVSRLGQYLG